MLSVLPMHYVVRVASLRLCSMRLRGLVHHFTLGLPFENYMDTIIYQHDLHIGHKPGGGLLALFFCYIYMATNYYHHSCTIHTFATHIHTKLKLSVLPPVQLPLNEKITNRKKTSQLQYF